MALNPLIALQGRSIDLATPIQNFKDQKRTEKLDQIALEDRDFNRDRAAKQDARADRTLDLQERGFESADALRKQQLINAEYENRSARDKARLDSLAEAAVVLEPLAREAAETGDTTKLMAALKDRRTGLGQRIAAGEDVNTVDTDEVIGILGERGPEAFLDTLQPALLLAKARGIGQTADDKGFTLSPGQQRFNAQGNMIAEGPQKESENKPPSGYRFTQDNNLEPIPGGPEDPELKQAAEEESKKKIVQRQKQKARIITGKVDEALDFLDKKKTGIDPTGLAAQVTGWMGGSDANQLKEMVKTVQANIGFEELQAMREASPTGGALGQVAVQELEALQAVLGSLNVNQKTEFLEKNLGDVKRHYNNWLNAVQASNADGEVADVIDFNDLPE